MRNDLLEVNDQIQFLFNTDENVQQEEESQLSQDEIVNLTTIAVLNNVKEKLVELLLTPEQVGEKMASLASDEIVMPFSITKEDAVQGIVIGSTLLSLRIESYMNGIIEKALNDLDEDVLDAIDDLNEEADRIDPDPDPSDVNEDEDNEYDAGL